MDGTSLVIVNGDFAWGTHQFIIPLFSIIYIMSFTFCFLLFVIFRMILRLQKVLDDLFNKN